MEWTEQALVLITIKGFALSPTWWSPASFVRPLEKLSVDHCGATVLTQRGGQSISPWTWLSILWVATVVAQWAASHTVLEYNGLRGQMVRTRMADDRRTVSWRSIFNFYGTTLFVSGPSLYLANFSNRCIKMWRKRWEFKLDELELVTVKSDTSSDHHEISISVLTCNRS